MIDAAHYGRLREGFDELLEGLSSVWPKNDIEYVREEVGYGEYGEALENLVALSARDGHPLKNAQIEKIETLAKMMGLTLPAISPAPPG